MLQGGPEVQSVAKRQPTEPRKRRTRQHVIADQSVNYVPVMLVLFDASRRRAYWLYVQNYFRRDLARQPKKGEKNVRVLVHKSQAVNRRAVAAMRTIKQEKLTRLKGLVDHD